MDTGAYYKLPDDLEGDIEAHDEDVGRYLSGDLAAGIFKARRVPRGIYEQRKDGTYMMRVRVAGGVFSAKQARCLADLSREYGNGLLHVTTRQDIQLHDVDIKDSPEVMRRLMTVGLTSKGGGGNTVRNVAACPYAGICPADVFDVTGFAHAVTEYLIPLAGSYNLPRKYKIAFSGCDCDCALARVTDLGFIAETRGSEMGFKVYVGGGMGAHYRSCDLLLEWVCSKEVIRIAEAVRRLFDRTGNRHDRSKARLRYVLEGMGVDKFREMFLAELEVVTSEGVPECNVEAEKCVPESNWSFERIRTLESMEGLRVFDQRQDGYIAVPVHLPLGFIGYEDFRKLGEVSEQFSAENGLRTTRQQNLVIRYVKEDAVADIAKALSDIDNGLTRFSPLERFAACAGASTCRLGLCLSRGAANASAKAIKESGVEEEWLSRMDINISGCPNACGHHPVGGIGLFGAATRKGDRLVPAYRILIGANTIGESMCFGEKAGMVPARAVPAFLVDMIKDYKEESDGNESFFEYSKKQGIDYFKAIVERFTDVPSYDDQPNYYRDWDADEDFSLAGRGAGECGAGVFEVINGDVVSAEKATEPYDMFLCSVRALLVSRGVDTQKPAEIINSFEKLFIDSGLVGEEFRALVSCGRGYLEGWAEAFNGKEAELASLLERVKLLYSTLDGNLEFHPPEIAGDSGVAPERQEPSAARELDLKGVACPMNFVKAKLVMEGLAVGDTLSLILDDGEPVENVPASFKGEGQEVVEIVDLKNDTWRVQVKKNK